MNTFKLEDWVSTDEKAEVALVSAPVSFPPIASLALSIFQASLDRADISSKILYTIFPMIHMLGEDFFYEFDKMLDITSNGEILVAHLTDVNACGTLEEFVDLYDMPEDSGSKERFLELLKEGTEMAGILVDAFARKIIALGAKVVAVSSIFFQQNASLAIMKRVKELDPSISTILGGETGDGSLSPSCQQREGDREPSPVSHSLMEVEHMDYRKIGETYYIRMDRGDEIISNLMDICRKEGILSAYYSGIGGCSDVEMQVFIPERGEFETEKVEGTLELVALMGNVVSDDSDQLFHHTHALFTYIENGEHKSVSGHLKSTTVLYTAEIELRPVIGGVIRRQYDPETGTGFWKF